MIARALAVVVALAVGAAPRAASPAIAVQSNPAAGYCGAIARALDASAPGAGPTFVRSYQPGPGEAELPAPLRTSAFAYDNALAVIALVACGDVTRARRIADAFVLATGHDRTFGDGRVRNAYRAGRVDETPAKLPGWWDETAKQWDEDAYQDGSSTGNAAWVALALVNAEAATGDSRYLKAASALLAWIGARASEAPGPAGYSGGVAGFDGAQKELTWKSTEHNIDVAAAAAWVHRLTGDPAEAAMAARAAAFVTTRFRPEGGYFLLGTKPDGSDAESNQFALDAQVWPVLGVRDAPAAWRRALGFADAHLRRGDGMTFAGMGANRWTEGTSQAALSFRAVGAEAIARSLLEGLPAHASPSGLLYATSAGDVPTGLMIEADGGGEFKYYHRPHLGATAWAALAAEGWNPFNGQRIR